MTIKTHVRGTTMKIRDIGPMKRGDFGLMKMSDDGLMKMRHWADEDE